MAANPTEVFATDWWTHARPVFEFHGYFRTRAELFHMFTMGRNDPVSAALFPQPVDNSYTAVGGGARSVNACGSDAANPSECSNRTQAGANLRFRINPELHISDNVRILSQVDLLDNLVLGSTPNSDSYASLAGFASTQTTPTSGRNSWQNSISVKRVWGEYSTPLGELRFGRMPDHWGLGMVWNAGDTYDSDWQSTVDRIMFVTGIKSLDLYFAGAWDFPNEGLTSALPNSAGGQPYDLAQLDDVNQYTAMILRRRSPELQRLDLARGNVVWNGGVRFTYRDQLVDTNDTLCKTSGTSASTSGGSSGSSSASCSLNGTAANSTANQSTSVFNHRGLHLYTPDIWFQLLYQKLRIELEGAMTLGTLDNTLSRAGANDYANSLDPNNPGWKIQQFGLTGQSEYRALEDKLRVGFGGGWASGDSSLVPVSGSNVGTLTPVSTTDYPLGRLAPGARTYKEFRFHPDYRIDLIFFRNILSRVQGVYYFRPSVEYDFTRTTQGQRLGGSAAAIWSRASEFMQTPGHKADLGLELNLSVYYQSKDGAINDNPDKMGGFFTMLQYGVLFPLGGLGYLPQVNNPNNVSTDTSAAHVLRWYMGILY